MGNPPYVQTDIVPVMCKTGKQCSTLEYNCTFVIFHNSCFICLYRSCTAVYQMIYISIVLSYYLAIKWTMTLYQNTECKRRKYQRPTKSIKKQNNKTSVVCLPMGDIETGYGSLVPLMCMHIDVLRAL